MKSISSLAFAAALVGIAAMPGNSAQASPAGAALAVIDAGKPVVEQAQVRRRVVRRRGNSGAAVAAGVIGAAIVGGAIIAESQRRERAEERAYYYGDGYYAPGYAPAQYYGGGTYYRGPEYNGRVASDRYGNTVYLPTPQPGYGGRGYYREYGGYPRGYYRNRTVRDPAGGGQMSVGP